jgi:hypothetical protein
MRAIDIDALLLRVRAWAEIHVTTIQASDVQALSIFAEQAMILVAILNRWP